MIKKEFITLEELYDCRNKLMSEVLFSSMPESMFFGCEIVVGKLKIRPIGEFICLKESNKLIPFLECSESIGGICVSKNSNSSYTIRIDALGSNEYVELEVIDTGLLDCTRSVDLDCIPSGICKYLIVPSNNDLYLLFDYKCWSIECPTTEFVKSVSEFNALTMIRVGNEFYFKPYDFDIKSVVDYGEEDFIEQFEEKDFTDDFEERMGMTEAEWELTGRD